MSKDRINTGELASLLATQVSGTPREAEDFLRAFIQVMEEQLLANDVLKIKGLGTFKLQWNEPRKSVDVNTAEEIIIDGYYKISFTPEPELKELVNAPFAHLQPVVVGGAEEEEMEEEEVEAVEEEVMKEMEDPGKLEEAMRSIAEQAIEIKDILAEMNMMGGSKKAEHRPAMVEEAVPLEQVQDYPLTLKETASAVVTEKPVAKEPVKEAAPAPKVKRPGPVVPYGPPPGVEEEEDPDEYVEESVSVADGQSKPQITVEPQPEVKVRKITEQPFVLEPQQSMGEREELPQRPIREQRRKARKGVGILMLLVGVIVGSVGTYYLNSLNLLPDLSTLLSRKEEPVMIPLSDSGNYSAIEDPIIDSLSVDSTITAEEETVEVDSLQLLFDTPREYKVFIATEEVREGSRMTRISERHYGAKEFWVYIYEANRNLLKHPDDIAKGMVLKIPRIDPRLIDKNNPRCIEYAVQLHDKYVKK